MLITGQLLAQRYRLGQRIAVGGMGEVWRATDNRLGRQVAVKVLKPELSGDAEFRQRFHTEAQLTASLNHPGIAAVHDYGEAATVRLDGGPAHPEPDTAFLVMELVAGEPLAAVLLRHPRLTAERTLDILEQAGDALQAAHERGLVHRDIKPGNILITPTGTVKLTDFGIAKAVDAAPLTQHGFVMGTAHYIAPEQAAGHEAGPAADVYSLGVVGYECLAGRRPFPPDNPVTVAMMHIRDTPPPLPPDIPPGVRALIDATLVKDPRQRYGTGGEFAAAVAAVRAGYRPPRTALLPEAAVSGPSGPSTGPYTRGYPGSERVPHRAERRGVVGVAVTLFVILGLVLGGYVVREMARSAAGTPGTGSTQSPGQQPAPPAAVTSTTGNDQAASEPTTTRKVPRKVFVVLTDYLLRSGSAAAATARDHGLKPVVLDASGAVVAPDQRSECRVTKVEPAAGWVSSGSSLVLTCKEGL